MKNLTFFPTVEYIGALFGPFAHLHIMSTSCSTHQSLHELGGNNLHQDQNGFFPNLGQK